MNEKEVTSLILDIATRLSKKYTFGFYDREDIIQEAFIIGMKGLKHYDGKRPLQNFLTVHIRNRLCNLKRDNYTRRDAVCQELQKIKRNLMEPLPINNIDPEVESSMKSGDDMVEGIYRGEIMDILKEYLPKDSHKLLSDLLRGKKLSKKKMAKLALDSRQVLKEHGKN